MKKRCAASAEMELWQLMMHDCRLCTVGDKNLRALNTLFIVRQLLVDFSYLIIIQIRFDHINYLLMVYFLCL